MRCSGSKIITCYRVSCLRERETKPQPNDMLKIGYCLFVLSFNIYSGHFLCFSMLSAYAGVNSVDNGLHQPDVMRKLVALKKKTMDMTFHLLNQFSTKACTRSDSDLKIKINNNQCGNSINSM